MVDLSNLVLELKPKCNVSGCPVNHLERCYHCEVTPHLVHPGPCRCERPLAPKVEQLSEKQCGSGSNPEGTTKLCSHCRVEKPSTEFYVRYKKVSDGLRPRCKDCEKKLDTTRRDRKLRRIYGITQEVYNSMLKGQDGKCAICRKKSNATLHVDHSHSSGVVRGLLCSNCNTGLGLLGDSIDRLRKAIRYLKNAEDIE